jgi:hypothetical protein
MYPGSHLWLYFTKLSKYRKDPTIGLKVIITGRHQLHGYNALIRDIVRVGENGPELFRVEVEATHRLENVSKANLMIRT